MEIQGLMCVARIAPQLEDNAAAPRSEIGLQNEPHCAHGRQDR